MSDSGNLHNPVHSSTIQNTTTNNVTFSLGPATYLITGGTGSLGTALTMHLLSAGHKVRVLARNEHGHEVLRDKAGKQADRLSCFLGAVEDRARLELALQGVDYCIHAAAQKVITLAEYNPWECVQTNVIGTENVVAACIAQGVKRAVFVSSDKACSPVTMYGASKLCGERLWLGGNKYAAGKGTEFVAVRYGNVWNSRGSIFQAFQIQAQYGYLILTDPNCTRFHWRLEDSMAFVLAALADAPVGELWVPKLPSYRLGDLARAFMQAAGLKKEPIVTGLRVGEKVHESMISQDESCTVKTEAESRAESRYQLTPGTVHAKGGWELQSGAGNVRRMSRPELVKLIEETR